MTNVFRATTAAVIAAGFLFAPALADAQGRRAVPRGVIQSRPAVRAGIYYGPTIYRTRYASPYFWYDPFYSYYSYPFYYSQWGYPGYPPYYYGRGYDISAALRLQVNPRQTEVFVDGYFAGTVDDFDGVFQRLNLEPGEHDLELFLPGHRSLQQKIYLQPGKTFSVRHTMEPLGPGDAEPARPSGTAGRRTPDPRGVRGLPPGRGRDQVVRLQQRGRNSARSLSECSPVGRA